MMITDIGIYGSHDASICIKLPGNNYRVYEIERFTRQRNFSLLMLNHVEFKELMQHIKGIIESEYGQVEYDNCYYGELEQHHLNWLWEIFSFNKSTKISHHFGHAAGAFYQSGFNEALIISYDSGGFDIEDGVQTFCVFTAHKGNFGKIEKVANIKLDVCGAYTLIAVPISEIWKTDVFTKYLTYAGKIMGLTAYGKVRLEWIKPVCEFYSGNINMDSLKVLGEKISLDLSGINTIKGDDSYDLAATSQYVFELVTDFVIAPYLLQYHDRPLIMTGGGALNVLMNESLRKKTDQKMFVPVNPNDCGLSLGFMLSQRQPEGKVSVTYSGFGLLDMDILKQELENFDVIELDFEKPYHDIVSSAYYTLITLIVKGKIIGICRGNSECGPRALGNRSIICSPGKKDVKNRLNKIKHREFFRPLAPVVRLEDAYKYFELEPGQHSEFMSYCPKVRKEWIKSLPGIVHEDKTARVQTVTADQNKFFHTLLGMMEYLVIPGVLVNTSLNQKGRPILTRVQDALEVLRNSDIDYMLIENYLIKKK